MYYNSSFSLVYGILQFMLYDWKWRNASNWQTTIATPILIAVFVLFEPCRLYLAWSGNLGEDVPQLAAFLFITLFFCPVIVVYNAQFQSPMTALDKALAWVYMCFAFCEFCFGLSAMVRMVRYRSRRYQVEHYALVSQAAAGPPSQQQVNQQQLHPAPMTPLAGVDGGAAGYPAPSPMYPPSTSSSSSYPASSYPTRRASGGTAAGLALTTDPLPSGAAAPRPHPLQSPGQPSPYTPGQASAGASGQGYAPGSAG